MIDRFLSAFASGDVNTVAQILAPEVTWISDAGSQRLAARRFVSGVDRVSRGLAGLGRKWLGVPGFSTETMDINGSPALVWRYFGGIERVAVLDVDGDRIVSVRFLMNPDKLRHLAASLGTDVASLPAAWRTRSAAAT
jgi:RNA polymerase sigma-70 factor (ECF subfamily)